MRQFGLPCPINIASHDAQLQNSLLRKFASSSVSAAGYYFVFALCTNKPTSTCNDIAYLVNNQEEDGTSIYMKLCK